MLFPKIGRLPVCSRIKKNPFFDPVASFDLSDLKKSPTYTITGRFIPFISLSFTLCTLFYDLTRDSIANNFVKFSLFEKGTKFKKNLPPYI